MIAASSAINATLYERLNFIRDIAPVACIVRAPNVLEVTPSFPAKAVPELIACAKVNPGKINMAAPGNRSGPRRDLQLLGLYLTLAGKRMLRIIRKRFHHVPAALALYPLPQVYSSPVPEVAADAELQPALSLTSASTQQVQREPSPKSPAPKKSKQSASRPRDPRNQHFMTFTQFHSYGYFRPW